MDTPAVDPSGTDAPALPEVPSVLSPGLVSRALEAAARLASDAVDVITATAGRQASPGAKANPFDWVTETDRTLERHTRRVLADEFGDLPVLGEEFGSTTGSPQLPGTPGGPDLMWIVDPVDGTANYVAGVPWSCYSLALVDAAGPLVGVIADPYRGQVYTAARGRGVRANRRPVAANPLTAVGGALLFTEPGRPGSRPDTGELLRRSRAVHLGVRLMGSSALAITTVALGQAVAAVLPSNGYSVWDVAGALAIAAEAGLSVTDLDGVPSPLPLDGVVVAVPAVAAEVLEIVAG
ncbi:inositol monophosphatase family protein [Nakamurella endophytica]|uniref:Myo-inositol-monophosphatase n=1 Tax=Nakamurella endophytica TaxID=1748367 RepID=A0A917WHJ6_9ACTN|nr:inositol monophosphatase family protein [Nakamurella endophytica]GGM03836.1 Myo-inositol-monophosphatase [Nakamurella endophytica]